MRVPFWTALTFAYLDEFVEGRLLRKRPMASVGEVRLSKKHMYFDGGKALRDLGMPQSPIGEAATEAVQWFKSYGYV